jgi:hypothetical protein
MLLAVCKSEHHANMYNLAKLYRIAFRTFPILLEIESGHHEYTDTNALVTHIALFIHLSCMDSPFGLARLTKVCSP